MFRSSSARWSAKAGLLAVGLVAAMCVFAGSPALADANKSQTVAGATGTVDESDRGDVEFIGGRVRIKPSKDTATAVIRYDVDFSDLDPLPLDVAILLIRYRDNGDDARVIAKLKRYNVLTGDTETLISFDSNTRAQERGYRYENFENHSPSASHSTVYAYWVEVKLIKNSAAGRPEFGAVRVSLTTT